MGGAREGGNVEELDIELGPASGLDGSPSLAAGNALGAGVTPKTGPPKTLLDATPNEPVTALPKPEGGGGEATSFPNTEALASGTCLFAGTPKEEDTKF